MRHLALHRLALTALGLALAGRAGAAPFQVSDEFATDAPVSVSAEYDQFGPAVASDGAISLLVWTDNRSSVSSYISGARLGAGQSVLDPFSFPISTGDADSRPAVAWGGANYLVVWQRYVSGQSYDIWGARVSPAGVVLDPMGFVIASATGEQSYPAVGWNGSHYLVAWQDKRGGGSFDIVGARVDAAGAVLDPAGIPICTALNDQRAPTVASDGTVFAVAWSDARTSSGPVYAARVADDGTVLDPQGVAISRSAQGAGSPTLLWAAGRYLGVWVTGGGFSAGLGAGFLDAALQPQGTSDLNVVGSSISCALPRAAFDGTDFVVAFLDSTNTEVVASRIQSDGGLPDWSPLYLGQSVYPQEPPAIGFDGTDYVLAWATSYLYQGAISAEDIVAMQLSPGGVAGARTAFDISRGANPQRQAAAAPLGAGFVLAWADGRSPDAGLDLAGVRVTLDGGVLNPSGLALAQRPTDQTQPVLLATDGGALLLWQEPQGLYVERLDGSGAPAGAATLVSAANSQIGSEALAWDGTNALAVWDDQRGSQPQLYGARITPGGAVLDPFGIRISSRSSQQTSGALAYGGGRYLVAWADYRSFIGYSIYGRWMAGDGGSLSGDLPLVTSGSPDLPALASDGLGFLLAYTSSGQVLSTRVQLSADGGADLTPARALSSSAGYIASLKADYDGRLYHVAWTEEVPNTSTYRVMLGRVLPDGGALDGLGVELQPANATFTGLASNGLGQTLVAYQRFDAQAPYGATRVRSRIVSPLGQGAACALDVDCATGHCTDGVCCDTACGGSDPADCQACSVDAGAVADGVCSPVGAGRVCRASAGLCDPAEVCDGLNLNCPADVLADAGTLCRGPAGACDLPEFCDGLSAQCPADLVADAGVVCRAAAGDCDLAELCDGQSAACPADLRADAGTVCRPAQGQCDLDERCDGLSVDCPADAVADAGTLCRSAVDACDVAEFCDGLNVDCPRDLFADAGTPCPGGACSGADSCVPAATSTTGSTGTSSSASSTGTSAAASSTGATGTSSGSASTSATSTSSASSASASSSSASSSSAGTTGAASTGTTGGSTSANAATSGSSSTGGASTVGSGTSGAASTGSTGSGSSSSPPHATKSRGCGCASADALALLPWLAVLGARRRRR